MGEYNCNTNPYSTAKRPLNQSKKNKDISHNHSSSRRQRALSDAGVSYKQLINCSEKSPNFIRWDRTGQGSQIDLNKLETQIKTNDDINPELHQIKQTNSRILDKKTTIPNQFSKLTRFYTLRPEQKRKFSQQSKFHWDVQNKDQSVQSFENAISFHGPYKSSGKCNTRLHTNDTEKVEDCLIELDAFLDEIERNYINDKTNTNGTSTVIQGIENTLQDDYETSVLSFGSCNADYNNRRHPFRQTISVLNNSTTLASQPSFNFNTDSSAQHQILWRRNSMRKTRPIRLPEQSNQIDILPNQRAVELETWLTEAPRDVFVCSGSDSQPLVLTIESTDISHVSMNMEQSSSNEINGNNSNSNETLQEQFLNALTNTIIANNCTELISTSTFPNLTNLNGDNLRTRQIGRRGEARARITSISNETNQLENQRIILNNDTRNSISDVTPQQYVLSEASSMATSRNTSPISIDSCSGSSFSVASNTDDRREPASFNPETTINNSGNNEKQQMWPSSSSRILAASCCTLGLFNISRFSIFTIHFGANFIIQFLILSLIYGIPMMMLLMCLGAKIKCGPIKMWCISPICKGIGISLVVTQTLVAVYSAISLAWVLVYIRDSFLSHNSRYRWQEPHEYFRGVTKYNDSIKLSVTVADYFNGVVLQRNRLGLAGSSIGMGAIRFQLAFNLAVLWIAVFAIFCKGLKSYGKTIISLMIFVLIGLFCVCFKMLSLLNLSSIQNLFQATNWQEFLVNAQSWKSAAQEVFLTWILFGASIISIYSKQTNVHENKTILRRDSMIIALITVTGLLLGAVLGNACIIILHDRGYFYFPGSFENVDSYTFLLPVDSPMPPKFASIVSKAFGRYSTVLGEQKTSNSNEGSGYQAIRLITEVFPAALAAASQKEIGIGWSIIGFVAFFLLGFGQLCAMWKPMASSLGSSTSGILLSCITGLLLATPLATESGIYIIHFLDVILGGSWFVLLFWVGHIFAIFLVRGRPYTSDILVNELHLSQTLSAFIALSWNVLLPVGLTTLCVMEYNQSKSRDLYHWRGSTYWPLLVRKIGGFIQIGLLMLLPLTSLVQIYRYLSTGPPDILDRIQLLYRPMIATSTTGSPYIVSRSERVNSQRSIPVVNSLQPHNIVNDAPPKYTPPPSYTTATGARLARFFRNSIRRSVRRIIGDSTANQRPYSEDIGSSVSYTPDLSLPPAYSTVLVDPSRVDLQTDMTPPMLYNSHTYRHTIEQERINGTSNNSTATFCSQSLTAQDVAQLLRATRSAFHRASSLGTYVDSTFHQSLQKNISRSAENLVLSDNNNLFDTNDTVDNA